MIIIDKTRHTPFLRFSPSPIITYDIIANIIVDMPKVSILADHKEPIASTAYLHPK
tara:strand:+ start:876 stop:1043 length:168 start_codon:yes stop_codon:yes gene_type:complete